MTAVAHHPHPVATAVASVRADLAEVATTALWSLDADQTGATLLEVQAAKAALVELEARLGQTNRDAWMLCPSAHRRAHDPNYTHERLPNGKIRFHRRT